MAHGEIAHIDLPVDDPLSASEFYGAVFGWRIAFEPGAEDSPRWTTPDRRSGTLTLRGTDFTAPRHYVEVDSIEDALNEIWTRGGTVLRTRSRMASQGWWAAFSDPDGNVIGLFEPLAQAG